ncbi:MULTISPECIES: CDP-diacylglycerol--serine O-phosphatidyltransferase [Embleya]|uniref:CDP-diacylglycerol--serine O-phosphatidyltransferase n=2 Tax=Embleya TaxID=2699295 RepID=A0A1T3P412_9ACTN|nr:MULTISPECIES: CDP-diacylglycerol--serine O-phosphatidyltransferase [Embleya]OPC83640.1 CDP-diacylglycerol--serine O-phosphatidyltransferase [Embleya scabrispora]GCE02079.1 CDP-diacylglycerol--serine O-phosphatidyltransferase [Embleya hyalina]GCE02117.1 CDP-diacylglycerol--serine O-phosphatidyltransferase [Embleya hyalina]
MTGTDYDDTADLDVAELNILGTPVEDDPQACLSSRISVADVLTLGNAACGFMAIYFLACSVMAQRGGDVGVSAERGMAAAVVLMLVGALCDLCDGMVARKLRMSSLGAQLDNLADVITFGVAPAFFVVTWAAVPVNAGQAPAAVLVALSVLIAGVLRLARFATTPGRPGVFQGMPIPMGAMTVVSIVLLDLPFTPAAVLIVAVSGLMVSRIEYPKPQGNMAILVMAGIGLSMSCLIAWAADAPGSEWMLNMGATTQVTLALLVPAMAMARKGVERIGLRMIR